MSWKGSTDKRWVLDYVLPEYQKVTEAPLRFEDVPGFSPHFTPSKLRAFCERVISDERARRYKAVDGDGNVYLVANPWTRHVEYRDDGRCWVVHPRPKLVLTYADAKREAGKVSATTAAGSKPSDDEFDY